ncbi:Transcription factor 25 [Allomyces javanicus]|nr:Transcription factor 25 [Allomyces javanicus]
MSGRAVRRLLREKAPAPAIPAAPAADHESDDDAPVAAPAKAFNPFALLMGDDDAKDDDDDEEEEEEEGQDEPEPEPEPVPVPAAKKKRGKKSKKGASGEARDASPAPPASDHGDENDEPLTPTSSPAKGKKKKKKNKKNKGKKQAVTAVDDMTLDELDQVLGGLKVDGAAEALDAAADESSRADQQHRKLFAIEARFMDPEAELARMFGSRVVAQAQHEQQEQQQQQQQQQQLRGRARRAAAAAAAAAAQQGRGAILVRRGLLATPTDQWPRFESFGLHMQLLRTTDAGVKEYTYVHPTRFQEIHRQFLLAVATLDPNNLMGILQLHPYHPDTLLQFSRVLEMMGDHTMARDCVSRALYALERTSTAAFSWPADPSKPARALPYSVYENRVVFLAMHRRIAFLARDACWRTAFEWTKLILSLDETDPLAMRLVVDTYALRAREYDWLIEYAAQFPHCATLQFSAALALWYAGRAAAAAAALVRAAGIDQALAVAVAGMRGTVADPLSLAAQLYVHHAAALWKDPAVASWTAGIDWAGVTADQATAEPCTSEEAMYRHIAVHDIAHLQGAVPARLRAHMMTYDPIPPEGADPGPYAGMMAPGPAAVRDAGAAGEGGEGEGLLSGLMAAIGRVFGLGDGGGGGGAEAGAGDAARAVAEQLEQLRRQRPELAAVLDGPDGVDPELLQEMMMQMQEAEGEEDGVEWGEEEEHEWQGNESP